MLVVDGSLRGFNGPACTRDSILAKSSGDEPGRCGGVRSGTVQGMAEKVWICTGEGPWEEWSARLWMQSTSVGASQHTLSIVYLPTGHMGVLTASLNGIDAALDIANARIKA